MADRETKEDEGLFDAVEMADETQVAAEVWTRYFAGENTRKILRFCQEQPLLRADRSLVDRLNALKVIAKVILVEKQTPSAGNVKTDADLRRALFDTLVTAQVKVDTLADASAVDAKMQEAAGRLTTPSKALYAGTPTLLALSDGR